MRTVDRVQATRLLQLPYMNRLSYLIIKHLVRLLTYLPNTDLYFK